LDSRDAKLGKHSTLLHYAAPIEDYVHTPYLTRRLLAPSRFEENVAHSYELSSYGPEDHHLYSLPFDTTYYDIPGRAPRCMALYK
jgi:hypothetical protein